MSTQTDQLNALAGVSRTLLIPLFARAEAPLLLPRCGFHDPVASTLRKESALTTREVSRDLFPMRLCIARTIVLEAAILGLLSQRETPAPQILLLACGLDTLPQRLPRDDIRWICGDFASVVETRDQLLPTTSTITHAAMALPNELDAIAAAIDPTQRPIIVLEGVLPYLTPEDVHSSFAALAEICPQGADILTDSYHPALLAFASLGKTFRRMEVEFKFGLANPQEYSAMHPRLGYQAHWDLLPHLPWYTRKRCLLPQLSAGKEPLATICQLSLAPA